MSFTGLFQLLDLQGDGAGNPLRFARIRTVRVVCERCRQFSDMSDRRGLEAIPREALLTCQECGSRQGVSNGRFDEFLMRAGTDESGKSIQQPRGATD